MDGTPVRTFSISCMLWPSFVSCPYFYDLVPISIPSGCYFLCSIMSYPRIFCFPIKTFLSHMILVSSLGVSIVLIVPPCTLQKNFKIKSFSFFCKTRLQNKNQRTITLACDHVCYIHGYIYDVDKLLCPSLCVNLSVLVVLACLYESTLL